MTDDPQQHQGGSLLENILARPGLYWGNSDNHFHSFVAFLSGYEIARRPEDAKREMDQMIPPNFNEFVTEYYGHEFPYGGHGWSSLIEANSNSDKEALDLFKKLRLLYDEKQRSKSEER